MKAGGLVLAGLRFHARTHAGVVLGAAIGAAVLVGALVVGDSVRESLRVQALQRIGRADAVLASGDRFFRAELAEQLVGDAGARQAAPALQLAGIASTPDSSRRANAVQVLGIDARFGTLALEPWNGGFPGPGQVLLNERLAAQLSAAPGETVVLRVERPSAMPRDMLLSQNEELAAGLRVEVIGIVPDAAFGRFGLAASQVPPFNAFLSLAWMQERLDLGARANLLLVDEHVDEQAHESAGAFLLESWTLADAQLELLEAPSLGAAELVSGRVFLDQPVAEAAAALDLASLGVLTYFVNELRHGERATPYSMVSALGPLGAVAPASVVPGTDWTSVVPADLADDQIVINTWLADDLRASVGDEVELTYFVIGPRRRLVERTRAFTVRAVVEVEGLAADATLMPDFPGLAGSEDCRDWDPGIPLDLDRIRDEDEAWWDEHRGTPKAFVTLAAGQAMWESRFGALTSVRVPADAAGELRAKLRASLDPAALGLYFRDLRGPALAASSAATDFGGLFLGLSLFLIVSALLLTAMLFAFGVEQRAREIGTLLAIGFRAAQVRRLFLSEAAGLALIGALLGSLLGLGYTRLVLGGLVTIWRDAVGATTLGFHARPTTVLLGAGIAFFAALVAILLAFRAPFRRTAAELLAGASAEADERPTPRTRLSLALAALGLLGSLALIVSVDTGDAQAAAGAFFGAGALVLIGAVAASHVLLARVVQPTRSPGTPRTIGALGLRGCMRRPARSLATIALLASGTFLVLAVGANRLGPPNDPAQRSSGTGGFALIGSTTLALPADLETPEGREAYGLDEAELAGVRVVPLRVRAGDDASCLNLSLPQSPRLVGVRPEELASRQAFAFATHVGDPGGASPWLLLEPREDDAAIPAIGDQASVTWSLHKAVGDTLDYVDERGRPFRVRIVATVKGSILQGNLLIGERAFERLFPSESGHRMLLIDAPAERTDEVAATLGRALADFGLELVPTATRLSEFNAVQNTYLLIFQLLGLLGLLLGSIGIGMVVLRNTLERRGELAIVRAVGFGRGATRWLVLSEHGTLLTLGLVSGGVAAAVALIPGMIGIGASPSPALALAMLALVAASGALWTWLATTLALRGELLSALRGE